MAEIIDLGGTAPQTTVRKKQGANNSLPISDILFLTLKKWPWIILSLIICVGAALAYILRTPTVYTRAAEIMIKDDSKGKGSQLEDFADFGMISSSNVANEITNLRSADLMEEVVDRLDLDVNYYRKARFHDVVAYGSSLPIKLEILNFPAEATASLNLNMDATGRYSITGLKVGDTEYDSTFEGAVGDSIKTDAGIVVVNTTEAHIPGQPVELKIAKVPVNIAAATYSSRLTVSQNGDNSSVIRLTLADQSIQRADAVLATLIEVYKDSWVRDKNQISVATSQFITERLGVIEGELGNVDSDISSYKSEHLIPDVQAASSMYMSQNQQLSAEVLAIDNQIKMARFVRNYLTSEASKNQLLPANSGLVGDIAQQINEYNDILLQRNALVDKSSESNPLIVSMDQQLVAMRNAIIATVDTQIAALNTQLNSVQGTIASTRSKIATSPTQAKYLLTVERQQKVKESLYLFLLQKREENELSQAFTAYNTRIVRKPGPAGVPPTPAKTFILLVAALAGLALPFAITFIKETSNTKVRGRKDIEHLPLPFLGEIPIDNDIKPQGTRKDGREVNALVVKEGNQNIINEAFRVLRTNVEFMRNPGKGADIFAVTSFNPGSGKSFVTVNLAMSMAIKGKTILVIDGDMRHGSTSSYVGSPESGLSNYLNGTTAAIESLIVQDSENPNLYILPVGPVPPNPTELLESPLLAELIDKVRSCFDYVFIDCPPIEIVADAQIIDRYVDRTIFVIRAGLLERSMLPELERIYDEKKYRNIALVLNGTAHSTSRYGYSHGYGYGYGYSYGYNNNKK